MAMTQVLSKALYHSSFKLRCLPVAVTILGDSNCNYIVDPTLNQLREISITSQKARLVFNVDTEELLVSQMEQTQSGAGLDFEQCEAMISLGLAAAKKLHKLIR
jgi:hypothetical protein